MEDDVLPPSDSLDAPRIYDTDQCAVPSCERDRFARGFCTMHYARWKRTGRVGDPEAKPNGHKLRGRQQSPEHVAKRIASMQATLANTTRQCELCGANYTPTNGGQRYCSHLCYDRVERQRNKKWETSRRLRIPPELRRQLIEAQDRKCAICGRDDRRLCVDHCHATETIRGMLCSRCNTALGLLEDDPKLIRIAASYVERHDHTTAIPLP